MEFGKNRNETPSQAETGNHPHSAEESFLGKTVRIKGNIDSEGPLTLEGKLNGDLISRQTVIVGNEGSATGKVEGDLIIIKGKVKGTVRTGRQLQIHRGARVDGDVTSGNVIIEEGGIFNGNMNMSERKPG